MFETELKKDYPAQEGNLFKCYRPSLDHQLKRFEKTKKMNNSGILAEISNLSNDIAQSPHHEKTRNIKRSKRKKIKDHLKRF